MLSASADTLKRLRFTTTAPAATAATVPRARAVPSGPSGPLRPLSASVTVERASSLSPSLSPSSPSGAVPSELCSPSVGSVELVVVSAPATADVLGAVVWDVTVGVVVVAPGAAGCPPPGATPVRGGVSYTG